MQRHNKPLLSVITPVLNARETVMATLHSVQTYCGSQVEHIVVDGGSKDGSWELLKADKHVYLVQQVSTGISGALNEGIALARGEYIVVLNADDQFTPGVKEVGRFMLDASAERPILYTNIEQYDPQTELTSFCQADLRNISKYMSVYHSGLFVPKEVYVTIGPYQEEYLLAMDCNFIHRCVAAGIAFQKVETTTCTMQLRGRSHINTLAAMREFERSVVHHKLQTPGKARLYRWRQWIFHSLHKYPLFQFSWRWTKSLIRRPTSP